MFGISGGEFLVILLVIAIVVGPQRLPEYTRTVTQWVRQLRLFLDNAKQQIAEEVGPELADINLSDLDPRNYDPRKIVRDALGEDIEAIRKDFENPIKSVVDAAKGASDEAAGEVSSEVNAGTSNKSLKQMIDDKAEETRAARAGASGTAAATGAAAAVAATADAGTAEDAASSRTAELADGAVDTVQPTDEPVEPAGSADASGTTPLEDGTAVEEPAPAVEEPAVTTEDAAHGAPQDAAEDADDDDEVEDPERRAFLASAAESAGDVVEDVAGILDPTDTIEVAIADRADETQQAESAEHGEPAAEAPETADGPDAPAPRGVLVGTGAGTPAPTEAVSEQNPQPAAAPTVPSSLVASPEDLPSAVAERVRPVSPRDIVRAANQAARTRAEAARARVDA
ncbi:Sec-independent protein translocase TatB [Actinomyces radicidentis]|uniref:Sec-independent protein translocase TatB n=1 Tax=Actinomyces radicidentis TaxID=111015 RepID=UPI0028EB03E8|nr:Sec-independent protein translocase TatB [Actinomyces radicidentis]